ncbi:hypothetical protein BC939DRAFT_479963 [Gamsiella multidivaricata]|uniref:uncharacterized protein n=1 Tax=Gamsiella multidivaricata TaxID=101098 RepID=UPI00221E721D|nr:uncharacterized protein BC939DRAFT_479963 [Gamsiella multidivaricata]KAI7819028.1 hypothetical protein BC939DRAFT_479963 [Gamsiella multidivaricata]
MTSNNHRNYDNSSSSSSSSNGIRDTNSLSKKLVETELDMNQVDTNQETAPPAQSTRIALPQGHTKPETSASGASISGVTTSSRQDRGVTANPVLQRADMIISLGESKIKELAYLKMECDSEILNAMLTSKEPPEDLEELARRSHLIGRSIQLQNEIDLRQALLKSIQDSHGARQY